MILSNSYVFRSAVIDFVEYTTDTSERRSVTDAMRPNLLRGQSLIIQDGVSAHL